MKAVFEPLNCRPGALPFMTFVLTYGIFRLASGWKQYKVTASQNSRKTMTINDSHRSSSGGGAVSSVVEHFLDTEGVTGSNPVSRTIFLREQTQTVTNKRVCVQTHSSQKCGLGLKRSKCVYNAWGRSKIRIKLI